MERPNKKAKSNFVNMNDVHYWWNNDDLLDSQTRHEIYLHWVHYNNRYQERLAQGLIVRRFKTFNTLKLRLYMYKYRYDRDWEKLFEDFPNININGLLDRI